MEHEITAMILAGGKGTRLQSLTKKTAKPEVSFGAKYRIIDFPLSNCANSGITCVGVLTQYESVNLGTYIGDGEKWGLNGVGCTVSVLSPRQTEEGLSWYKGTADAIYQNLDFLDEVNTEYVLILSGDHIYSTTYDEMLAVHKRTGADCTISVIEVDWKEASRFGILDTDENDIVTKFSEKPKNPTSNLASMGVYIFTYKALRKALVLDAQDENSSHDFGKNIIPYFLDKGRKIAAYRYKGYWRDVGTISSLHEANMDLLPSSKLGGLNGIFNGLKMMSEDTCSTPTYYGKKAVVNDCLINQGAIIKGHVEHSVISNEAFIDEGALVVNSVVMPRAHICSGAKVYNAIVAPDSFVDKKQVVNEENGEVILYNGRKN